MVMHTIEDVEQFFNSCGFGILHFTDRLEDTYVLVMNQNYTMKDRVYLVINYTIGRDDNYDMIYVPVITDICTIDENAAAAFESNPKEHMDELNTITDQFEFDNMPDEILSKDYDSEFEQLIDFVRLKADLNFTQDSAEFRKHKALVARIKVTNMSILDDILGENDYEELDNDGLQYNDIINKPFKFKNVHYKIVVTDDEHYLFFQNGCVKIKETNGDRDLFISRVKTMLKIK